MPAIEECAISQYFPVGINQICEERMKYIALGYPEWSIAMRKLEMGVFLTRYKRRGDVVSMVNLLRLSAGNTVLEIRYGPLEVYKGGRVLRSHWRYSSWACFDSMRPFLEDARWVGDSDVGYRELV